MSRTPDGDRPKQQTSIRIDPDVLEWLRDDTAREGDSVSARLEYYAREAMERSQREAS